MALMLGEQTAVCSLQKTPGADQPEPIITNFFPLNSSVHIFPQSFPYAHFNYAISPKDHHTSLTRLSDLLSSQPHLPAAKQRSL